jgi:maltodextrin utilization protein YvdJ
MESLNPININFSKSSSPETDYTEFKDYIIRNNVELQKELKEKIELVKDLEATITENETEEDKYDNRVRYMKGLLQNLNEQKNEYRKISEKIEEKQKLVQDLHLKNKKNYYAIYKLLALTNLLTIISPLHYVNYLVLIYQTCYVITISYCCLKIKEKYTLIQSSSKETTLEFTKLTTHINKLKEDVKKTEEATLSLDNWICEL